MKNSALRGGNTSAFGAQSFFIGGEGFSEWFRAKLSAGAALTGGQIEDSRGPLLPRGTRTRFTESRKRNTVRRGTPPLHIRKTVRLEEKQGMLEARTSSARVERSLCTR